MNRVTNMTSDLGALLQGLRLTEMRQQFETLAEEKSWQPIPYLYELAQLEQEARSQKRIESLLKKAKLPRNKTIEEFDFKRLPNLHLGKIKNICEGDFIDRLENLLIFGNPGTGKTHLSIAFAKEWCLRGRSVFYAPASNLVHQLLQAKKELMLDRFFKKMDRFNILIIDDISYVPYSKEEMDVLFLLLSERYEQRSTLITSNLVFSDWNQIFKDEITANAVIDRLVHHSIILELNGTSYRMEHAKTKNRGNNDNGRDADNKLSSAKAKNIDTKNAGEAGGRIM